MTGDQALPEPDLGIKKKNEHDNYRLNGQRKLIEILRILYENKKPIGARVLTK